MYLIKVKWGVSYHEVTRFLWCVSLFDINTCVCRRVSILKFLLNTIYFTYNDVINLYEISFSNNIHPYINDTEILPNWPLILCFLILKTSKTGFMLLIYRWYLDERLGSKVQKDLLHWPYFLVSLFFILNLVFYTFYLYLLDLYNSWSPLHFRLKIFLLRNDLLITET